MELHARRSRHVICLALPLPCRGDGEPPMPILSGMVPPLLPPATAAAAAAAAANVGMNTETAASAGRVHPRLAVGTDDSDIDDSNLGTGEGVESFSHDMPHGSPSDDMHAFGVLALRCFFPGRDVSPLLDALSQPQRGGGHLAAPPPLVADAHQSNTNSNAPRSTVSSMHTPPRAAVRDHSPHRPPTPRQQHKQRQPSHNAHRWGHSAGPYESPAASPPCLLTHVPKVLELFLRRLLQPDAVQRPSATAALTDPLFLGGIPAGSGVGVDVPDASAGIRHGSTGRPRSHAAAPRHKGTSADASGTLVSGDVMGVRPDDDGGGAQLATPCPGCGATRGEGGTGRHGQGGVSVLDGDGDGSRRQNGASARGAERGLEDLPAIVAAIKSHRKRVARAAVTPGGNGRVVPLTVNRSNVLASALCAVVGQPPFADIPDGDGDRDGGQDSPHGAKGARRRHQSARSSSRGRQRETDPAQRGGPGLAGGVMVGDMDGGGGGRPHMGNYHNMVLVPRGGVAVPRDGVGGTPDRARVRVPASPWHASSSVGRRSHGRRSATNVIPPLLLLDPAVAGDSDALFRPLAVSFEGEGSAWHGGLVDEFFCAFFTAFVEEHCGDAAEGSCWVLPTPPVKGGVPPGREGSPRWREEMPSWGGAEGGQEGRAGPSADGQGRGSSREKEKGCRGGQDGGGTGHGGEMGQGGRDGLGVTRGDAGGKVAMAQDQPWPAQGGPTALVNKGKGAATPERHAQVCLPMGDAHGDGHGLTHAQAGDGDAWGSSPDRWEPSGEGGAMIPPWQAAPAHRDVGRYSAEGHGPHDLLPHAGGHLHDLLPHAGDRRDRHAMNRGHDAVTRSHIAGEPRGQGHPRTPGPAGRGGVHNTAHVHAYVWPAHTGGWAQPANPTERHLAMCRLAGMLLFKCLLDGRKVATRSGKQLSPVLFKHLVGAAPSEDDLHAFDPAKGRLLHQVMLATATELPYLGLFFPGGTANSIVKDQDDDDSNEEEDEGSMGAAVMAAAAAAAGGIVAPGGLLGHRSAQPNEITRFDTAAPKVPPDHAPGLFFPKSTSSPPAHPAYRPADGGHVPSLSKDTCLPPPIQRAFLPPSRPAPMQVHVEQPLTAGNRRDWLRWMVHESLVGCRHSSLDAFAQGFWQLAGRAAADTEQAAATTPGGHQGAGMPGSPGHYMPGAHGNHTHGDGDAQARDHDTPTRWPPRQGPLHPIYLLQHPQGGGNEGAPHAAHARPHLGGGALRHPSPAHRQASPLRRHVNERPVTRASGRGGDRPHVALPMLLARLTQLSAEELMALACAPPHVDAALLLRCVRFVLPAHGHHHPHAEGGGNHHRAEGGWTQAAIPQLTGREGEERGRAAAVDAVEGDAAARVVAPASGIAPGGTPTDNLWQAGSSHPGTQADLRTQAEGDGYGAGGPLAPRPDADGAPHRPGHNASSRNDADFKATFEQAIRAMSQEALRGLLVFVTGAAVLPSRADTRPGKSCIVVERLGPGVSATATASDHGDAYALGDASALAGARGGGGVGLRLPRAFTCANLLLLPDYGCAEKLQGQLEIAIRNEGTGYGL
eukprot:jgi/Mesvir1/2627/Mv16241-RA.1